MLMRTTNRNAYVEELLRQRQVQEAAAAKEQQRQAAQAEWDRREQVQRQQQLDDRATAEEAQRQKEAAEAQEKALLEGNKGAFGRAASGEWADLDPETLPPAYKAALQADTFPVYRLAARYDRENDILRVEGRDAQGQLVPDAVNEIPNGDVFLSNLGHKTGRKAYLDEQKARQERADKAQADSEKAAKDAAKGEPAEDDQVWTEGVGEGRNVAGGTSRYKIRTSKAGKRAQVYHGGAWKDVDAGKFTVHNNAALEAERETILRAGSNANELPEALAKSSDDRAKFAMHLDAALAELQQQLPADRLGEVTGLGVAIKRALKRAGIDDDEIEVGDKKMRRSQYLFRYYKGLAD
jgi:hypothetical protein